MSNFESDNANEKFLGVPDACPECKRGQDFGTPFFVRNSKPREIAYAFFQCRFSDCRVPFFAVYTYQQGHRRYSYHSCVVSSYVDNSTEISELISDISPDFEKIFVQATSAEQNKLDLIAGGGYRKALEFLIKDYCIYQITKPEPENEHTLTSEEEKYIEKIKVAPLSQVINNELEIPKVKSLASRAAWIGNDETHYERRLEKGDIEQMKSLMRLVIHYIEAEEEAKKLEAEIQPAT